MLTLFTDRSIYSYFFTTTTFERLYTSAFSGVSRSRLSFTEFRIEPFIQSTCVDCPDSAMSKGDNSSYWLMLVLFPRFLGIFELLSPRLELFIRSPNSLFKSRTCLLKPSGSRTRNNRAVNQ